MKSFKLCGYDLQCLVNECRVMKRTMKGRLYAARQSDWVGINPNIREPEEED